MAQTLYPIALVPPAPAEGRAVLLEHAAQGYKDALETFEAELASAHSPREVELLYKILAEMERHVASLTDTAGALFDCLTERES